MATPLRNHLLRACALLVVLALAWPACAWAQTDNIDADPTDLQREVESSGLAYDQAVQQTKRLQAQASENAARLAELNEEVAQQQAACETTLKELYKFHRDDMSLFNMVFSSESISSFFSTMDYFNRVQESYDSDLRRLNDLCDERARVQEALERDKADAEAQQQAAEQAFSAARQRRDAAQKAAREQAQADALALQRMADAGAAVTPDGADWTLDRVAFINAWKGRLDRYLSGSPLAGYGANFAAAAWDNGIDPRFSAAISCMESSKGRHCFLPHNAWGWGQVSWGSWDEAIAAHARGLARGYGYTITLAGAKKYCPPNWEHWYATVSSEMSLI